MLPPRAAVAVRDLWRWAKFAGGPTAATALLSVTTLGANIIIYRLAPLAQAGRFALLTALAQTLALLAGLGQPAWLRRRYSLKPLGECDWPRDLAISLVLSIPAAAAASLAVWRLYGLSARAAAFVLFVTLGLIAVTSLSQLLGSQRLYLAGSLLLRLPFNLMLPPLLFFAWVPANGWLTFLGGSLLACYALSIAAGLLAMRRWARRGTESAGLRERVQGLAFVVSGLAYQLPEEGLFSLAGMAVASPDLAAVAAFTALLRPFGMLFDGLNQILLTELARRPRLRFAAMLAALAGLTAASGLAATALLPPVASLLYNGRYDRLDYLVPLLVLSPALQLFEVLGRAHVNARAPLRRLNLFILAHLVIALAGAGLTFGLIQLWGVAGLAVGAAVIYIVRTGVSYGFSALLLREGGLPAR